MRMHLSNTETLISQLYAPVSLCWHELAWKIIYAKHCHVVVTVNRAIRAGEYETHDLSELVPEKNLLNVQQYRRRSIVVE